MGVPVDGSLLVEAKPTPPKRAPRTVHEDVGGINGVRVSFDGRFRSTPTFRSRVFLESYWADFCIKAGEMAKLRNNEVYRSMSAFNCKSCEFSRLCFGELSGYDTEHIANTGFKGPEVIMEDDLATKPKI